MSDLVVSGTIEETLPAGTRTVDGTKVNAHIARVRVDRVFQGEHHAREASVCLVHFANDDDRKGVRLSGPPLADFRLGNRYLIFLKRARLGWDVAMPLYTLEDRLVARPPHSALRDLSHVPQGQRYQEVAEELENAALAQPVPPPGMTGEAESFFSSVYDLLGGCAEPFYRRFLSSSSPELRSAASDRLGLIRGQPFGL